MKLPSELQRPYSGNFFDTDFKPSKEARINECQKKFTKSHVAIQFMGEVRLTHFC
jgi:hypothetical protein